MMPGMGREISRSRDAEAVVIRRPESLRIWMPVFQLVLGAVGTALLLTKGQFPWPVLFIVVAGLSFWMGRKPEVVADSSGITFRRGAKVTWSEVTSVEPPPDNGWKHQQTDLVLRGGTRRLLAFDLDPGDLRRISGLLAASRQKGSHPGASH